ncbi:rRNA N6-adenosine-methyltransferase ZCCHC4 [Culicoides brevitarsis]|uniref:rRNA N6-adenosine-methyltransferase ZCCHC4 n=1 Tax=Culicoides brevitarsis TaxID=469753 RepID=UPI00307B56CD
MKPVMTEESKGIRVIIDDSIKKPWCPHGPTLLFESTSSDKSTVRRFFACSACRDRSECPFYQEYDSESEEIEVQKEISKELVTFEEFQKSPVNDRFYCMKTHSVYLKSKTQSHSNFESIPFPSTLTKPSEFLPPKSNDKKEAQYFFSTDTLTFFTRMFRQLSINKVLCIGAPAMHDELLSHGIKSFLLDIDDRLFSFYPRTKFAYYNMFNHHFFRVNDLQDDPKAEYLKFLKNTKPTDSICIFTDPPFGCLTDPLADTLRKIQEDFRKVNEGTLKIVPIVLVFPYFMETYVRKVLPELSMSDYRINYVNHEKYNEKSNSRKDLGSPVRFFTNILPNLIKLPKEEYRYCEKCERFVSKSNNHCKLCGICPSKNGSTYKHCKTCHFCVKPNYVHCPKCNKCTQKPGHKCLEYKKYLICSICKGQGHPEISCEALKIVRKRIFSDLKLNNKKNCLICCTDGHTHFSCLHRETILEEIQKYKDNNS